MLPSGIVTTSQMVTGVATKEWDDYQHWAAPNHHGQPSKRGMTLKCSTEDKTEDKTLQQKRRRGSTSLQTLRSCPLQQTVFWFADASIARVISNKTVFGNPIGKSCVHKRQARQTTRPNAHSQQKKMRHPNGGGTSARKGDNPTHAKTNISKCSLPALPNLLPLPNAIHISTSPNLQISKCPNLSISKYPAFQQLGA